jgi:hypothetical protein
MSYFFASCLSCSYYHHAKLCAKPGRAAMPASTTILIGVLIHARLDRIFVMLTRTEMLPLQWMMALTGLFPELARPVLSIQIIVTEMDSWHPLRAE